MYFLYFRLAHDIAYETLTYADPTDDDVEVNCNLGHEENSRNEYSEYFIAKNGKTSIDFSKKEIVNLNAPSMHLQDTKSIWNVDVSSSNLPQQTNVKHSSTTQPLGRKRRRLPEIPKDKPGVFFFLNLI